MIPASTDHNPDRNRNGTAVAPTSETHEPIGCEITSTMPFDDMFEDMTEIDDLGDAGPPLTLRDGRAYSDFS